MELSHDYTDAKKGGVMESASRRVRMIFSVMASPNRIDILRILNSKGPLTYSELKALAGFKSKKESGKFAYHLRKLLRQSLVALNKAERKYTITNLGKLVLSLARQIEERSIIESGKMYVRTSGQTIQEFNSHKIIQSLVREGNMPPELAQKIAEEVEGKIYKLQTAYLTAPLIREMVNAVLIEHGHEEYRNRLARVGMPVFDLVQMLGGVGQNGIEGVMSKAVEDLLSEYLVFSTLPKDIVDSHLAGDIHISKTGLWGLLPDTVFVDMNELAGEGMDLKGRFLGISRLGPVKTLDDLRSSIALLNMLLSREVSGEIFVDGLMAMIQKCDGGNDAVTSMVAKALVIASGAMSYVQSGPLTSFNLDLGASDGKKIDAVLKGYEKYVNATPVPKIGLVMTYGDGVSQHAGIIADIVRAGGSITLNGDPKRTKSALGVARSLDGQGGGTMMSLQSLAINLPRLAYESNKDEIYFRARLALLLKPSIAALSMRKKALTDLTVRGMLPTLANSTQFMQKGSVNLIVNLVDLHESVAGILGYGDGKYLEIAQKVVKTSVDVAAENGRQDNDAVGIAMITDDSAARFAALDTERFGKIVPQAGQRSAYSQGMTIPAAEMTTMKKDSPLVVECNTLEKMLNGGLLVTLDVNDGMGSAELSAAIQRAADMLTFLRPRARVYICGNCGQRSTKAVDKCQGCNSPHIVPN